MVAIGVGVRRNEYKEQSGTSVPAFSRYLKGGRMLWVVSVVVVVMTAGQRESFVFTFIGFRLVEHTPVSGDRHHRDRRSKDATAHYGLRNGKQCLLIFVLTTLPKTKRLSYRVCVCNRSSSSLLRNCSVEMQFRHSHRIRE